MKINFIKCLVLIITFFIIIKNADSQSVYSISSKSFINDIKTLKNDDGAYILDDNMKEKYAIFEKDGIFYVSGLAKIAEKHTTEALILKGCIVGTCINDILSVRVPLSVIDSLEFVKGLLHIELGRKVKPHLKDALVDTKSDSVHNGILLPQAYTGKDVIIGVTDWGFDYTHPTFYDSTLTELRIISAWDQYKTSGPAPAGFQYGTEYSSTQSLLTAAHDTANIYSLSTHGTHVAGIAAGSGAGTVYKGFAPEAQLAFVTILVDEASVLDAFNYLYQVSLSHAKPLVVNMSWGLYYIGNLDGSSLISQSLDYLRDLGVTFVSSAGNNGDVNFHIKKDFQTNDTLKTVVEFEPYAYIPTMWGQSVSMWGTPDVQFTYGISILDNTNNHLLTLPMYNTLDEVILDTNIVIGSDTIIYKIESEMSNAFNQRPGVRLRVRNLHTNLYKIVLNVAADSGRVHLWNVIELVNDVGNWGASFSAPLQGFTAGDNNYSIGEPACADGVIAVGAYKSQVTLINGNTYYGNIAYFSSKGPLINEVMKPDITAPGQSVGSSISSFYDGGPIGSIANVDFNGKLYKFGRLSGTSMSGPAVAGIAALILQTNPTITPSQVKDLIKTTARQDNYTGIIPTTGDVLWGWGKINAYHAVRLAAGLSSYEDFLVAKRNINVYPNPSNGKLYVDVAEEEIYAIKLFDLNGRIIYETSGFLSSKPYEINLTLVKRGTYFIEIINDKTKYTHKVILY